MVKQICFWVVGNSIAVDLHDADSNLVRPLGFDEPIVVHVPAISHEDRVSRGWSICAAIAQSHGLDRKAVSYDEDSEDRAAE